MDINISQMMNGYQFENKNYMGNSARKNLKKQETFENSLKENSEITVFKSPFKEDYLNAQLSILKANSKINDDITLCETLKYLITQKNTKVIKKIKFGELWNSLSDMNIDYSKNFDFIEIDFSKKNIFEAA